MSGRKKGLDEVIVMVPPGLTIRESNLLVPYLDLGQPVTSTEKVNASPDLWLLLFS